MKVGLGHDLLGHVKEFGFFLRTVAVTEESRGGVRMEA